MPTRADAPCDGAYRSWGRACHGGAFVREKTIEWNSSWSACKPGPYRVLDSVLEGKPRRVAYEILKPGKACRYKVVEIVEDQGDGEGWNIVGYTSLEAYQRRFDREWVLGSTEQDDRTPTYCPVDPMPSKKCNLPFTKTK